jgi:ketosteroid isomerase-like protein
MHGYQRVTEMAVDVVARRAGDRAKQTGEPFEEALKAVLETETGRQLSELRDGPHRDERTQPRATGT